MTGLLQQSRYCRRLHIDPKGKDGLIGGKPPGGVVPLRARLRYFATLPLEEGSRSASLFVAPLRELLDKGGFPEPPGVVEILEHEKVARAKHPGRNDSVLTPNCLRVGERVLDLQEGSEDPLEEEHKLGGRPYLKELDPRLIKMLEDLGSKGFQHFLQMGFPGLGEDIGGNWPFANGLFSLFRRKQREGKSDWLWFFQP